MSDWSDVPILTNAPTAPSLFHLVYQSGLANVFTVVDGKRVRLLQHAFRPCEDFCRGAIAAGATVKVWHADIAGDVAGASWTPGDGGPFADSHNPPVAS